MTDNDHIQLGFIRGAHGLRGHVVAHVFSGNEEALTDYGPLLDASLSNRFTFKVTGSKSGDFICKVNGIEDRNQAESLKGTKLYIPASALPEPDEDDYYIKDLIGLRVITAEEIPLGQVVNVTYLGAHDALEIKFDHDGHQPLELPRTEYLLFTKENVPELHLKQGYLVVNLPEGIFSDVTEKETLDT